MIEINDLHKSFGDNKVLDGVNLVIKDGETFSVIGCSGCGKSVLLKHIVGLMRPDKGDIKIDNQSIINIPKREILQIQAKFGVVFQGSALFDSLNVKENVAFGIRNLAKFSEKQIDQLVKEKLDMVGLKDIEDLKPAELSGGMKKRVALARAIAYDPKYILYDEPTTGLDPVLADVIDDLIIHLQKQLHITSVVVTHDMKSVYKVSQRIGMLCEGKIIEIGTPEEIKNTKNPNVRQFISGKSQ